MIILLNTHLRICNYLDSLDNTLAFHSIHLYNLIMSRSAMLFRLQNIDSQIHNINNRIVEIEKLLKDKKILNNAENQVLITKEKLADNQKTLRAAENNVKDQQYKIENTDKDLYSGKIQNPKELQDLQNESAALRRYLEVLEDRQLEAMIAVEEAEINYQEAQENYVKTKSNKQDQHISLSNELSNLNDDLERLHVERNAVIQTVNKDDLDIYENLLSSRRGLAVVAIIDRTCGACGTTLPPAMIQSAQSPSQIVQCHSCKRIIYPG